MKRLSIDKKKLRKLEPTKNAFRSLVGSIISQQISTKAAVSINKKFVALFAPKKFPTPSDVTTLSDAHFRSAGISTQKIGYLRDLAAKFLDGTINPKKFPTMTDQDIVDHLVQVKGVGEWTAHMFLIFALNRADVLPTGDLAIRKGFMKAFNLRKAPSHERMVTLARPYAGNRTQLSLHLWASMDELKK